MRRKCEVERKNQLPHICSACLYKRKIFIMAVANVLNKRNNTYFHTKLFVYQCVWLLRAGLWSWMIMFFINTDFKKMPTHLNSTMWLFINQCNESRYIFYSPIQFKPFRLTLLEKLYTVHNVPTTYLSKCFLLQ